MIQAIQTMYAGIRFRSRLEARWAVFFERCGIDWRYESVGFTAEGFSYLPDFYLPRLDVWCEVKGDKSGAFAEREKLSAVLRSGAAQPLLLLGDIPSPEGLTAFFPALLFARDLGCIARTWAGFAPLRDGSCSLGLLGVGLEDRRNAIACSLAGLERAYGLEDSDADEFAWSTTPRRCGVPMPRLIGEALRDARQARFEHGETPRVGR